MKQSNRILVIFGVAMALLAIAAVLVVVARGGDEVVLLPESEPAGVVQRYIMALQNGDYEGSLRYIAPPRVQGDPNALRPPQMAVPRQSTRNQSWRVTLGDTRITGDKAQVDITAYVFRPGGPFGNPVQTTAQTFFLVKQNNAWLIENPEGPWWMY